MKRLIKKFAEYETPSEFLWEWVTTPDLVKSTSGAVEKMASENPDCVYSGNAFRFIELFGVDAEGKGNDELMQLAQNKIRTIYKFDSFALSKRAVEYFVTQDDREFGVIIQANVQGIDVKKLADKYKEEMSPQVFDYADTEDEVIPLSDVSAYDIVALVIDNQINWLV